MFGFIGFDKNNKPYPFFIKRFFSGVQLKTRKGVKRYKDKIDQAIRQTDFKGLFERISTSSTEWDNVYLENTIA
jgi:hypothetical protein